MLRGSRGIGHHCLNVRAHDRPDPRLARVTPELIRLAPAAAEAFAQSLHRYVETDLGPVTEAVDDCPRRIRDGNVDILDAVTLDPFRQRRPRKAHEPDRWIIDLGAPGGTVDLHP